MHFISSSLPYSLSLSSSFHPPSLPPFPSLSLNSSLWSFIPSLPLSLPPSLHPSYPPSLPPSLLSNSPRVYFTPNRALSGLALVGVPGTEGRLHVVANSQIRGTKVKLLIPFKLAQCPLGFYNPSTVSTIEEVNWKTMCTEILQCGHPRTNILITYGSVFISALGKKNEAYPVDQGT